MKSKIKIAFVGVLSLCAVFSAIFALTDLNKAESENKAVECMAESGGNNYVLRDYEGYVAIFIENNPSCPMTVTDIQVSTLRELDRQLLQTGMKIASKERLMMTLEDLGS